MFGCLFVLLVGCGFVDVLIVLLLIVLLYYTLVFVIGLLLCLVCFGDWFDLFVFCI